MTISPLLAPLLATLLAAPAADVPPAERPSPFDDFSTQAEFPAVETVRAVLRPVEGFPGEITESNKLGRPMARLAGLFRYDEVWPAGSALRIALVDIQSLAIHVWAGDRGVSLRFRPEAGRSGPQWAVYGAGRQGGVPRPEQLSLWATDEGRFRRLGEGTLELRWSDGLLAMTRGDTVLWRVPLESPPKEVFVDGSAMVRGLGTFRSATLAPPTPDLPLVRDVPRPAELAWQENLLADATFNKLPGGAVELSAMERGKAAQVFASPGPAGLHEFIFEVENPQPGSGVYLGSESGEPLARAGFFRSRGRAGLTFGLLGSKSLELERSHPDATAIPYAGTHAWLRLVLAGGIARLWTSGDGRHWSQPPDATMRAPGGCRTVGLYCLADPSARSIRLRSLHVRCLDALAALAPTDVVEQVRVRPVRGSRTRTSFSPGTERPDGVSEEVWRRATAVRMLIDGPNPGVGQAALAQLVRDAMQTPRPVEQCLGLLAQAARLTENGDSGHAAALSLSYEQLGRRLMAQRDPAPFSRLRRAMSEASLGVLPAAAAGQLLRYQLLLAAYEGRWDDLTEQTHELQYWSRSRAWSNQPAWPWEQALGPLIDWGAAQLETQRRARQAKPDDAAPAKDVSQPAAPVAARTRKGRWPRPASLADTTHPLVDRLGKEAYNVAADLEAALAGGSLREACQIIRGAGNTAAGLVPGDDPQLFVTLQVAVERALAAHAGLAGTMEQNFGALADLRFQQATDVGDPAAVESLADQFPGTRAARRAQQWLGDRALAAGQFAEALGRYRHAWTATPAPEQPAILPRLRLAGTILGQSLGDPPSTPIEFGDTRMAAPEFEQLVVALHVGPAAAPPASVALPANASTIQARDWAEIPVGPEQRAWNSRRPFDPAARQTVIRFADQTLLLSTPARLLAFRLGDGRLAWTHTLSEAERSSSSSGPVEPVVFGPRVFLRRGLGRTAQLECLDLGDGRLRWTSPDDTPLLSDPVPVGPCLFALVSTPGQAGQLTVQVAEFDAATGRVLGHWPAIELRDLWQGTASARATWADDNLVATLGGCVIACDATGRLRWVRRQVFLGPQVDSPQLRLVRSHDAPRVLGGRVYATQPGVWAVECIELASGRLLWRRAEPDLLSLVAADAQRVLLATGTGLVALDAATGKPLWSHVDLDQLDAGVVCDAQHVLHATLRRTGESQPEAILEWLDAATGAVRVAAPVSFAWDRPGFGPLALGPARLMAILSRPNAPQRQIAELKVLAP
jgi:outer membrane protein assembly factor BamB